MYRIDNKWYILAGKYGLESQKWIGCNTSKKKKKKSKIMVWPLVKKCLLGQQGHRKTETKTLKDFKKVVTQYN